MPDTYEKDGIKYCKNCNTPREKVYEANGKSMHVPTLCDCQYDAQKQSMAEEEEKLKNRDRAKRREQCFGKSRFAKWTFDSDDLTNPDASKAARNYVENFNKFRADGMGLILFGEVGRGKSFLAACIANKLIDEGYSVYMTNMLEAVRQYSSTEFSEKDAFMERLNSVSLLIIDDYGTERATGYNNDVAYQIIDTRYRRGLPMIITTNLTMRQLFDTGDVATAKINDRLIEICCPVEVKRSRSRRKDNGCAQKLRDMKAILEQ